MPSSIRRSDPMCPPPATCAPGTTFVELLFALTLLGILIGLAYPPLARAIDGFAVRGARDSLAAGVARARTVAIARGGAALVVDTTAARFWIRTEGGELVGTTVSLAARYGVALAIGGAGDSVALRFDARGLGRLANRTFRLRRGGAEAHLTLSTYGRPRRW